MNESEKENIKNIVTLAIDSTFVKLVSLHKDLLKEYLVKVVILVNSYMPFDNYIEQLKQNNNRDIFSLLVLLLPYYDLPKSKDINDLGELFYNKDNKSKNLSSTYYCDHLIKNNEDIKKYFETSLFFIQRTLSIVSNKLTANWLNIFPYTMNNYKTSKIYEEFEKFWLEKKFPEYKYDSYYDFKLGYNTLFGTIKSFLYDDIKNIKWMIYDILIDAEVIPTILLLVDYFDIKNIINEPWNKLTDERKKIIENNWYDITNSQTKFNDCRSFIMFYLRWEKDNDNLGSLNLPEVCLKLLKNNLDDLADVENFDEEDIENFIYSRDYKFKQIYACLEQIKGNLKLENLYNYIYTCCQQFRYTWYSYKLLDENKKFLSIADFNEKYKNSDNTLSDSVYTDKKKYYITPKMTYNFFKSMLHEQNKNNEYVCYSNTNSWDTVLDENKKKFIKKLNSDNYNWFSIRNNLKGLYKIKPNDTQQIDLNEYQTLINEKLKSTKWIPQVIIECLVYNGILTYFKYNPEATNNALLPDKNKMNAEWQRVLFSKVSLEPYKEAYHFLDNKQLGLHTGLLDFVKKSKWYTNFGADWICQIQVFHHFIHQRIMFVTGSTGAGKSTVFPFMMVYALKIINYNNNGKVFCTQPRIQPTKGNAVWMAQELGIPTKKEEILGKSEGVCGSKADFIKSDIDYVQYKYAEGNVSDDLYHPTLRLMTDGLLYAIIKNDYVFKKRKIEENNKKDRVKNIIIEPFTKNNLFDVLLIDESHEHNPYMDMILTMCKFALYMNNQISLGIVSATMDDDEPTYRKYYEPINDDWKAPLKLDIYNQDLRPYTRNFIDRRIHLSVPFGGMNFYVQEFDKDKRSELEIIKEILATSKDGDILVFKPGTADINKLIDEINPNVPSDVLAIPFIGTIPPQILEGVIKEIARDDVRKSIRYKKNYTIDQICDIPESELLPVGTYKRFIIVATNIAEASITIDTLKYIIDDGKQKIMYYDVNTNQSTLKVLDISTPNQKQRKGRVGRTKPGIAYYTYDISSLDAKVIYKLCSDNINDKILDLLAITNDDTNEQEENKKFKFTDENNPYLVSTESNEELNILFEIPEFLREQYSFINASLLKELFFQGKGVMTQNINYKDIIYPDADGKYDVETLIDEEGKFYIIHPNEKEIDRNMPESFRVNTKKLEELKRKGYKNKVEAIINYLKLLGIMNEKNKVTPYGKLISSCQLLFEFSTSSIELILTILDLLSFRYSVNDKTKLFKNIIWYCVFTNNKITIKLPKEKKVYSDFLGKSELIPENLLNIINLNIISDKLDSELGNLSSILDDEIRKIIKVIPNYKENYDEYKTLLKNFYMIKIKIEILEELSKEETNIISSSKKDIHQGKINKNCQQLKNINMKDLIKKDGSDISIINMLNDYEKTCFFICKNMKVKLLLKMSGTPYYINYFDRNYTNIYQINYFVSPYDSQKRIITTNVYNEYRNNILFYLSSEDDNKISNIMWIPTKIIYLLQKITKTTIKRNNTFDKKILLNIHGEAETNNIIKKIDIINDYIENH